MLTVLYFSAATHSFDFRWIIPNPPLVVKFKSILLKKVFYFLNAKL